MVSFCYASNNFLVPLTNVQGQIVSQNDDNPHIHLSLSWEYWNEDNGKIHQKFIATITIVTKEIIQNLWQGSVQFHSNVLITDLSQLSSILPQDIFIDTRHFPPKVEIYVNREKMLLCDFISKNATNKAAKKLAEKAKNDLSKLEEITRLDLIGCDLETLPEELSLLSKLIYLDLTCNKFKEVPSVIFRFKNLKVLILRGNKLSQVPESLLQMKPPLNKVDILENPIRRVSFSLQPLIRDLPYMAKWC